MYLDVLIAAKDIIITKFTSFIYSAKMYFEYLYVYKFVCELFFLARHGEDIILAVS